MVIVLNININIHLQHESVNTVSLTQSHSLTYIHLPVSCFCSLLDCERTAVADMIFLVDGSSSINQTQYKSMQRFMTSLVNTTDVGEDQVRFGAIVYSDNPESKFTLNDYKTAKEVRKAIENLPQPGGNTYTGAALRYALQYFGQPHGGRRDKDVTQILFIITDGAATDPVVLPVWSKEILNYGIRIYGIGVAGAKESELQVMTGDKRRVFYVNNFDALDSLHMNISNELCEDIKPGKPSFFLTK